LEKLKLGLVPKIFGGFSFFLFYSILFMAEENLGFLFYFLIYALSVGE